MSRISVSLCFLLAAAFIALSGCKKNNPVEPPAVDPALVGVWYNSVDSVGFEIIADGTMKNLDVAGGKLEYAPPQDTVTGSLTFTIESAKNGVIAIKGSVQISGCRFHVHHNGNVFFRGQWKHADADTPCPFERRIRGDVYL